MQNPGADHDEGRRLSVRSATLAHAAESAPIRRERVSIAAMVRRWATAVLALAAVLLVAGTGAYRYTYGSWWQSPQRIPYCGRTYMPGASDLSLADIRQRASRTALSGEASDPLISIGKTPPVFGADMLAVVTPEAQRQQLGIPCTMALYLKTGNDQYRAYGLSGGP